MMKKLIKEIAKQNIKIYRLRPKDSNGQIYLFRPKDSNGQLTSTKESERARYRKEREEQYQEEQQYRADIKSGKWVDPYAKLENYCFDCDHHGTRDNFNSPCTYCDERGSGHSSRTREYNIEDEEEDDECVFSSLTERGFSILWKIMYGDLKRPKIEITYEKIMLFYKLSQKAYLTDQQIKSAKKMIKFFKNHYSTQTNEAFRKYNEKIRHEGQLWAMRYEDIFTAVDMQYLWKTLKVYLTKQCQNTPFLEINNGLQLTNVITLFKHFLDNIDLPRPLRQESIILVNILNQGNPFNIIKPFSNIDKAESLDPIDMDYVKLILKTELKKVELKIDSYVRKIVFDEYCLAVKESYPSLPNNIILGSIRHIIRYIVDGSLEIAEKEEPIFNFGDEKMMVINDIPSLIRAIIETHLYLKGSRI